MHKSLYTGSAVYVDKLHISNYALLLITLLLLLLILELFVGIPYVIRGIKR